MRNIIYLDNAATTKPYDEVVDAVSQYITDAYGNPGGYYSLGDEAKNAVKKARVQIASTINAVPHEICFTSGGSESDNLAIKGLGLKPGDHVVTTAVEHKAVLNACAELEKSGVDVTYVYPDERGFVSVDSIEKSLRDNTKLVSVMMVNNEIGTVMPIKEIGELCRSKGIVFHVDAVQAYGHMPIDVRKMSIDLMSASGHKFHALKGCGFLYVREGIILEPIINGGGQERGLRAGTENVPGIVSMGVASEIAHRNMHDRNDYLIGLRDRMIERILNEIPGSELNGSLVSRCANNVNVRFKGVSGESLIVLLDCNGICASTGSACNSSDGNPSHVLSAIGLTPDQARGSLRFTLSEFNTYEEVD